MEETHNIMPDPHEKPTLIDYKATDNSVRITLDTMTMQATKLHLHDAGRSLNTVSRFNTDFLDLSDDEIGHTLGQNPWLINSLDTEDVRQIISIKATGGTKGALGYLAAVLENPLRRKRRQAQQLRALRAGLSVGTTRSNAEYRIIDEPQAALYIAHPRNGQLGSGYNNEHTNTETDSVNRNENYLLYITTSNNPYGDPVVTHHADSYAAARAILLICEPIGETKNRVLAQLVWPLISTQAPVNQRMLNDLANQPVLIEQLILASLSARPEDAQRMVAYAQSQFKSRVSHALSPLAIISYPEHKTEKDYDEHSFEIVPAPITITPSEIVTGKPVQHQDIVICYPSAARYLVTLDRLHRHKSAIAQAIDKEALAEAVAQTQWLHEERGSMSDARLRAALSDICADLIQEAAARI